MRELADDDRLQLPQPTPPPTGSVMRTTVSRIWWSRRAFSAVVQSAMRSPSTLQRAAPFAVVVAVEAEVQAGAEVEARVGDDLDLRAAGASRRPWCSAGVRPAGDG